MSAPPVLGTSTSVCMVRVASLTSTAKRATVPVISRPRDGTVTFTGSPMRM